MPTWRMHSASWIDFIQACVTAVLQTLVSTALLRKDRLKAVEIVGFKEGYKMRVEAYSKACAAEQKT